MKAPHEELVERLTAHRLLQTAPRAEIEWLAEHGTLRRFEAGAVIFREGDPIPGLFVVLSGRLDIRVHRGGTVRRVLEWRAGDISGILPFSRMRGSPGTTAVNEAAELLEVESRHFPELIRDCQAVTAICVHVMLDRARHFRSSDLHDEKLASLGRLAAGLAHELNNPASAVARNAATLLERLPALESTFRALGGVQLSEAERAIFGQLREHCLAERTDLSRSPLDDAERIEALADWLERRELEREGAEELAETSVTIALLDRAVEVLRPESLRIALDALAAGCGTRRLALDLESAATRVHELVAAVKGFTYMDQAATPKAVDLARGLADTMTVLRAKAKSRSVRFAAEIDPGLPPVMGLGGELNQIWSNLLDNAIDASPEGGTVTVGAARRGDAIVVRIVDAGGGIPPELQSRIFEPFFTTKPVGEGTGLGLALVRNLVTQHGGEVEIESRPGHTEFRVAIPLPAPGAAS
jgi:signal transduction histidine kinase